jgi:hypothetical protein
MTPGTSCLATIKLSLILNRYVRSEQRGKTANWPRLPKGCDENGPAAALLVGYVSI